MFDKIFDIKSPMVRAAAYISRQSHRDVVPTIGDLGRALDTGLGEKYRLRQWTLFVPATAKEANDRFDASAAQFLVAMAGQPQDMVGLAAATPSDPDIGKVAQVGGLDANLVSVTLDSEKGNLPPITVGDLVNGNPFRLRLRTSAGRMMPLANLHGRFIKTFSVGGVEYPTDHIAVLHEDSGYWVLDLDRVREVLKRMPRTTVVEMSLVTQAEKTVLKGEKTTGLAHSKFFDGVIDPVLDLYTTRSLAGAQLSAAGGSGRME